MAEKVKHHFVPKFYLKLFVNSDLISLYHIEKGEYVIDVPADDQAQKKRLYGDNAEMEDAFGQLEAEVAPILKKIVEEKKVPTKSDMKYFSLMNFVVLQNSRTLKAIEQVDEGMEQMIKTSMKHYSEFEGFNLDDYKIKTKDAFVLSTGHAIPLAIESYDLEPLLIINDTKHPFVTSDNPCIRYNQFAEQIQWYNDGRGYGIMGLQIFLPLNEKLMLAFFDKEIYRTNKKGKKKTIVNATESDVLELNKLQYVCADECLYFKSNKSVKKLAHQKSSLNQLRDSFIPSTQEFQGDDGYLIAHTEPQLKTGISLSFFEIKSDYMKFDIKGLSMGGLKRESFDDTYVMSFDKALKKFGDKHVTMKLFELLHEKQKRYGNV